MTKPYVKIKPLISLTAFLQKAKSINSFTSSTGSRYKVVGIDGDEMVFIRLDVEENKMWRMNLKNVYWAYQQLENFTLIDFKPFVPFNRVTARGLLLRLEMLK